jgi:hypothetical protein
VSQSESDDVAKGDFSRLLLLVDIANIRPRSIKNKKRFQANFGMKLPLFSKTKYEPTCFAFIDQCLFDLARSAPGAVIVKYADFGLKSQLVGDDGEELIRRNSLDDYDSDKIFIVGTSKADNALLTASFEVGGSIISQDQFADTEYAELWTESTRLFVYSYNEESEQFDFLTREGLSLQTWWQDENSFVSGDWLASDEYLEVEVRLRNQAKQANWQWITTPLVHNPEIPVEVYERIEATSREKRRQARKRYAHRPKKSLGRQREVFVDQGAADLETYEPFLDPDGNELTGETFRRKRRVNAKRSAHAPKKFFGRQRDVFSDEDVSDMDVNDPLLEFTFSEPSRSQSVCYLLADDFHGMRKNIGNRVTVAGRVVLGEGKVCLQWIPGTEAVEVVNHPNIDADIGTAFVQLDGVLEVLGNSIVLRTDDDEMFTVVTYAHIREERNAQKRESRVLQETEMRKWAVPSFIDSVQNLRTLRHLFKPAVHADDDKVEGSISSDRFTEVDRSGMYSDVDEIMPGAVSDKNFGIPTSSVNSVEPAGVPPVEDLDNKDDSFREHRRLPADNENTVRDLRKTTGTPPDSGKQENVKNVEPVSPVEIDGDVFVKDRPVDEIKTNQAFLRRRILVVGVLAALLVSIAAYVAFSSDSSGSSSSASQVSTQSSAAQWRYFESVVWRK